MVTLLAANHANQSNDQQILLMRALIWLQGKWCFFLVPLVTLLIEKYRLLAWYTIITALFRCPSSRDELTQSSPAVCTPYLATRERVSPFFQPYYDTYAAPHVERARPYVRQFNDRFYSPSMTYGKHAYDKYGAPQIDLARNYSQEQWSKIVKPQIDAAQYQAQSQYTANVAPHVSKASAAAAPYYSASKDSVFDVYSRHLIPAYEAGRPYFDKVYATGNKLAVDIGLPYLRSAWGSVTFFFDRILWPKIRILYGENVEPQLVRIGERLGRYRDGKKIQSIVDEVDSSSTAAAASSSMSSVSASIASAYSSGSNTAVVSATPTPSLTPEQEALQTRERIDGDLKNWQDKFAKAADKGTEDLQERISDIITRQLGQVRGVGSALLVELEETSSSEESKLQKKVVSVVKSLGDDSSEEDIIKGRTDVSSATRKAGLNVKQKAEALRDWKETFDAETLSLAYAAGNSTLDVINSIRDLGLQEIGIRWANMEGVTYKDWSKYHDVKKTFDEMSKKVVDVAQNHPGLTNTMEASENIESAGMNTAKATAKELTRLKEVGLWKIDAHDTSDDFSTKYMAAGAAVAAQKVMQKVGSASEHILGTSQGTVESMASRVTEHASGAMSEASSAVMGTEPGIMEKANSKASIAASSASQQASEAVIGTEADMAEKAGSQVSHAASQASKQVSEAVLGTPQPSSESLYSKVSEVMSEASMQASGVIVGNEPVIANQPVLVEQVTSRISEAASKASKEVSEGIMGTPQARHESIYSAAKENLEQVVSDASEAVVGTPAPVDKSVASEMTDSAKSLSSSASEAVYGSSTPVAESLSNAAKTASSSVSSLASEATKQAKKVYGGAMAQEVKGQKPILDDIMEDEQDGSYSEKMQNLMSQAGDRYAEITKAVDQALSRATTTQGTVESASSVAGEHYLKALSAASSALYGTQQGTVESVTSVAANKWLEAVAA